MPALSVVMVALSIAQNKTVVSSHDGASALGRIFTVTPSPRLTHRIGCLFVYRNMHKQLFIFAACLAVIETQSFHLFVYSQYRVWDIALFLSLLRP